MFNFLLRNLAKLGGSHQADETVYMSYEIPSFQLENLNSSTRHHLDAPKSPVMARGL